MNLGANTLRNGIFVATDRRILFYGKRTFGYDLESFTYKNISSIEMSKKFTGHSISFFASGNKVSMKMINIGDINKFVEYVRGKLNDASSQTGNTKPVTSVADDIKKFAELKEAGIITEEEFEAKKKQLLGI